MQPTDLDQFQAKRLKLGEHPVKGSLVGEHTRQDGVTAADHGLQLRECRADQAPQLTADADLVLLPVARLPTAARVRHPSTANDAAYQPAAALKPMRLMATSPPIALLLPTAMMDLSRVSGQ